jgi:hypothetical protein
MKVHGALLGAALAVLASCGLAQAQNWGVYSVADAVAAPQAEARAAQAAGCGQCGDPCGVPACGDPRCEERCEDCPVYCPGIYFDAEATMFRYFRADGARVGDDPPGDNVRFGYYAAPRMTVGWVTPRGLGFRTRYWEYSQADAAAEGLPSRLAVEAYTLDMEVFQALQFSGCWTAELSGGIRYTGFEERMFDLVGDNEFRANRFYGWGGIVGLELKRSILRNSALFGRVRGALSTGDHTRVNVASGTQVLLDTTHTTIELAVGYEYRLRLASGAQLFARAAAEWQTWFDYSSNFATNLGDGEQTWSGSSNVGFAGLTLSTGINF